MSKCIWVALGWHFYHSCLLIDARIVSSFKKHKLDFKGHLQGAPKATMWVLGSQDLPLCVGWNDTPLSVGKWANFYQSVNPFHETFTSSPLKPYFPYLSLLELGY